MIVLDMIDLIVTPSIGIGTSKVEINERSSPEAVTAFTAVLIDEISARIKERGDFDGISNLSMSGIPDAVPVRHKPQGGKTRIQRPVQGPHLRNQRGVPQEHHSVLRDHDTCDGKR